MLAGSYKLSPGRSRPEVASKSLHALVAGLRQGGLLLLLVDPEIAIDSQLIAFLGGEMAR